MHRLLTYSLAPDENLCCVTLLRYSPLDSFPPLDCNGPRSFPPLLDPTVDEHLFRWRLENRSQLLLEHGKAVGDEGIRYVFIAFQMINDSPLLLEALIDRLQGG
jgi:hypothetical protein